MALWKTQAALKASNTAVGPFYLTVVTNSRSIKSMNSLPGTGAFGERMNSLPKYVASTTLQKTEWNASLIKGDLAEAVNKLKQEPGQDVLVFGSGNLVHSLHERGLVDEYRLMVFPIVLGSGKRLFPDGDEKQIL